jgi:hypothetical protein
LRNWKFLDCLKGTELGAETVIAKGPANAIRASDM